jgi:hypothetical protein
MTELDDELRRIAEHGADRASPLPPAEVMRRGDKRRRRRIVRECAIGVAAAVAVAVIALAGTAAVRHQQPAPPGTRPAHPTPLVTRHARVPAPTPVPSPGRPSALPPSPAPSHPLAPTARPTPTPAPSTAPAAPAS